MSKRKPAFSKVDLNPFGKLKEKNGNEKRLRKNFKGKKVAKFAAAGLASVAIFMGGRASAINQGKKNVLPEKNTNTATTTLENTNAIDESANLHTYGEVQGAIAQYEAAIKEAKEAKAAVANAKDELFVPGQKVGDTKFKDETFTKSEFFDNIIQYYQNQKDEISQLSADADGNLSNTDSKKFSKIIARDDKPIYLETEIAGEKGRENVIWAETFAATNPSCSQSDYIATPEAQKVKFAGEQRRLYGLDNKTTLYTVFKNSNEMRELVVEVNESGSIIGTTFDAVVCNEKEDPRSLEDNANHAKKTQGIHYVGDYSRAAKLDKKAPSKAPSVKPSKAPASRPQEAPSAKPAERPSSKPTQKPKDDREKTGIIKEKSSDINDTTKKKKLDLKVDIKMPTKSPTTNPVPSPSTPSTPSPTQNSDVEEAHNAPAQVPVVGDEGAITPHAEEAGDNVGTVDTVEKNQSEVTHGDSKYSSNSSTSNHVQEEEVNADEDISFAPSPKVDIIDSDQSKDKHNDKVIEEEVSAEEVDADEEEANATVVEFGD